MTRVQDLILRVQRLPELTQRATLANTTRTTHQELDAAFQKVDRSRATVIELGRLATAIGAGQLEGALRSCRENVNETANLASKLTATIARSKSGLLPPNIDKRVQSIKTSVEKAVSSSKSMWNPGMRDVIGAGADGLEIAKRLGIPGAASAFDQLLAIRDGGPPLKSEDTARIVECHQAAQNVLDSLPQEGPVGSFIKRLVHGDGASLSELADEEVQAFVKKHSLEERLVVRLAK